MAAKKKSTPPSRKERAAPSRAQPTLATAPRAPIRVLLRPAKVEPAMKSLHGRDLVILGPAPQATWGGAWCPGDLEGIMWVQGRRVNATMYELRMNPNIADVQISGRDVQK
jgi:hypothetical protein